jgi:hypothetical protein
MKSHISFLLKKVVFLASTTLMSPSSIGKNKFSSTLNVMFLQIVRNECIRFGEHIGIQVSYKILWLED